MGSFLGLLPEASKAQSTNRAVLSGTVTDSTGAVISGAATHLAPADGSADTPGQERDTDRTGHFGFTVPAGLYVLTVEAPGFAVYTSKPFSLNPSGSIRLLVRLEIASLREEINIKDDAAAGGTDPNDLAGATVFEGKSLDLLSNDTATLQQQLSAMAGGIGTPRFLIDGFSGGRLPPKASIRSIRINRNPYSAYFADLGFGRVEVNTKPGSDQLHGQLDLLGTDQPLDARNPYTPVEPPFYDFQQNGDLNGPLGKKTAFFASDAIESLANTSVVNAADPEAPSATISQAVPAPQHTETFALRIDRQFSPTNFGYVRDEWSQTHISNSGINPLVLPEAAFSANTLTNTLQLADSQVLGPHSVNEARFQYLRTRVRQDPNSTAPSVVVEGSFQSGGSPTQALRDNEDAYEVQDLFELDRGKHAIRTGFRFRALRDSNESTAGFNGQYIFPDVASFLAGQPTQFSQTTGAPGAVLSTNDLAIYAEDDWKITPRFTLSYGLRFESQSAISDHSDPAPRLGFAWAVHPNKQNKPLFTLRGGYGIFYDRFPAAQLLQAVRQNGIREVANVVQDPAGNPFTQPTLYRVDPALKSSYGQAGSLTAVRSLGRYGALSANLVYIHNTHNFLTRNINAPLPGTFDPESPSTGTRPLGSNENLYQFSSSANGNQERFFLLYNLQLSSKITGFGRLVLDRNYGESDGVTSFPSNGYDVRADYARLSIDRPRSLTSGFDFSFPKGFDLIPFLDVRSGLPFDITTGTDRNGDTIYNDRPSFATKTSPTTAQTAFGSFETAPVATPTIPRNFATSPGLLWIDLQVAKALHVGPRPPASRVGTAARGAPPDRPWELKFVLDVQNLTNHNNPGRPVGVLGLQPCPAAQSACTPSLSPFFGHSLSLANDFSPNTASNRTILLQTTFTF